MSGIGSGGTDDVDVSGWRPAWEPARTQLRAHAERVRSLRGRRVADAWIVWNREFDEWFADLPVVVQFEDGVQLEVCWMRFDDLSITWNTIDVAVTPRGWVDRPLEWRSQAHPALRDIVGDAVVRVDATDHLFTTRRVGRPDDVRSVWLPSASGCRPLGPASTSSTRWTRMVSATSHRSRRPSCGTFRSSSAVNEKCSVNPTMR